MNFNKLPLVALSGLAAYAASATTLSFAGNVDNTFTAYVSTSPTVTGTLFAQGNSWPTTYTGSIGLTPGVTNYLQVHAVDLGPPAMLIAKVSLSDASFTLPNGTQTEYTNITDWTASVVGFGGTPVALSDEGPNGTSPWGSFAAYSSSARFIWPASGPSDAYFTLAITPVPEPASVLGLGLGLVLLVRRRKS